MDLADFVDFASFVRLSKSYDIDYEALLVGCTELDKTLVEGVGIGVDNKGNWR